MKNWKTTMAGILAIIGGITTIVYAIIDKQLTSSAITAAATAILTGVGLLFAKDYNVTGGGDTLVKLLIAFICIGSLSSCSTLGSLIKSDCTVQYNSDAAINGSTYICLQCKNKIALQVFDSLVLKAKKK